MKTLFIIIKVILSSYLHMYQWMVVCYICDQILSILIIAVQL